MNPASSAPDPSRPEHSRPGQDPYSPQPGASGQPAGPRRWWLIGLPLLLLVVGYGGYRLGHTSGTAAQTGTATVGTPTGQAGTGQAGTGQYRRNRQAGALAGQAAAGSAAPGQAATFGTGTSGAIIAVQTSTARTGVLVATRTATGTVATTQQTVVSARTSGTVSGLPVPVGSMVKAGQTVVSLSSSDLITAVQSAQNALDTARVALNTQANQTTGSRGQLQAAASAAQITLQNAQTTLNAQERLYSIGAISQTDLNTARAQVQQAQSTLSSAQNSLNQNSRAGSETLASLQLAVQKAQINLTQAQQAAAEARVTAPFGGQVTAIAVSGGQYLNAGAAAFTLTSSQRQVNFTVPPSQSASIRVGQILTYTAGQKTYTLKVAENAGAPVNGNVQVVARFVDPASMPVIGSVGSVSYPFTVAQGVLVPSTALQLDGEKTSVFTVAGGRARQIDVTVLGQANSDAAVSGLDSGAQVITLPPSGLLDGASVTTNAAGARAGSSSTARSGATTPSQGTRAGSASNPPAGAKPAGGPGGAP